jgi:hypothetical protein
MATTLAQLVAVEKGVKARANDDFTKLYHLAQKPDLWSGISRTYQPKDEEGERYPPESTRVQVRVGDVLDGAATALVRLFDVTATKDEANSRAKANVVVDDLVLLSDVPVPTLLFLEKQLVDLRTFVTKLPLLSEAEEWSTSDAHDAYCTPAVQTIKTKKVPRNHVKAEATDKHPAQVELYYEDVAVGYWTTVKLSGACPSVRVKAILERIDKLTVAVKHAREYANRTVVTDQKVGEAIFGYLFAA